jgi:DNA-binding NarL/FixJ family response regulator
VVQPVVVAPRDHLVRDVVMFVCERAGIDVVGLDGTSADVVEYCTAHPESALVPSPDLADGPLENILDPLLRSRTSVLVLADESSPERAVALFEAGIRGLLYLDAAVDSIADAVRAVQSGGVVLHPWFAATVLREWRVTRKGAHAAPGALTPRERDVLSAMTEGLSTKAIARSLAVAPKTVENHKIRIFSKLGVRNQAQAVGVAITHGLVAALEPVGPAP